MPVSRAQVRWAHAVLEGDAKGDKGFASEVVDQMHGEKMKSLPNHVKNGKPEGVNRYRPKKT